MTCVDPSVPANQRDLDVTGHDNIRAPGYVEQTILKLFLKLMMIFSPTPEPVSTCDDGPLSFFFL